MSDCRWQVDRSKAYGRDQKVRVEQVRGAAAGIPAALARSILSLPTYFCWNIRAGNVMSGFTFWYRIDDIPTRANSVRQVAAEYDSFLTIRPIFCDHFGL